MTDRERWEEIGDELGTYDLEYVGYAYVGGDELVKQEPPAVGQWMQAEDACKRLAAQERELERLRQTAGRAYRAFRSGNPIHLHEAMHELSRMARRLPDATEARDD